MTRAEALSKLKASKNFRDICPSTVERAFDSALNRYGKPDKALEAAKERLHALTNAISGVSGVNILGVIADNMCKQGIKNSDAYLEKSLSFAQEKGWELTHISISIEALKPKMAAKIGPMKMRIGELTGLDPERIGITATSGEKLSRFGEGEGIMVFCSVTMRRPEMEL